MGLKHDLDWRLTVHGAATYLAGRLERAARLLAAAGAAVQDWGVDRLPDPPELDTLGAYLARNYGDMEDERE